MTKELRSLQAKELRVAKADDGSRTITGAVTYNTMSLDLGGFREIIAPGAFASSLQGDVLCLRDHDATLLMGRTKSGTLTLADTADGLNFSCSLPNTTAANDLAESIDRKDLDGVSFGFCVNDQKWAEANGVVIRTVLTADLLEISPCSFAAYPANTVSVRSCPPELRAKLTRTDDEEDCRCECASCLTGDCEDCNPDDCTDDDCRCHGLAESDRNRLAIAIELRMRGVKALKG